MTTVSIMSMQRILNYGSSLQAYSLKRLVEQVEPDARVRFVDYRPGIPLIAGDEPEGRLSRTISKIREYGTTEAPLADKFRFFNHKRAYAQRYFPLVGIPSRPDFNLKVDTQIIGSDEVFNCVQSNTRVGYSRDLFGHQSSAGRVVSYAASFGNTTIEKIVEHGIRDTLAADLSAFTNISVRDRNSADIVESLIGNRPQIHLDPTLVYDLANDPAVVNAPTPSEEAYIIVYGYSGRFGENENSQIRSFAKDRGFKVLAFGGLQGAADEFVDCDPFTLLRYFQGAKAVITDTFHGTIFSTISRVPFATMTRRSHDGGYGNEEKLSYLLEALGLESRLWDGDLDLEPLLTSSPDFAQADSIRELERARTLDFLGQVLTPKI